MLVLRERPAAGDPEGMLILHHGRGTDELDLFSLADVFDPQGRLHVVTPRAPYEMPGAPGYHWYRVVRVGYPDPTTFRSSRAQLAELHDALWERTGLDPSRTILGGFSMGAVMSYALGLSEDRPAPAGILALSGFIPTVQGWDPETASRSATGVLIAHARNDPVIGVEFGRRARELLEAAGIQVDYRESEVGHSIDPADVPRVRGWLDAAVRSS
jgi:phospholipase/carboxylesterase